jgi:hypothetical protein
VTIEYAELAKRRAATRRRSEIEEIEQAGLRGLGARSSSTGAEDGRWPCSQEWHAVCDGLPV